MALPRSMLTIFAAATITLFLFYQLFGHSSTATGYISETATSLRTSLSGHASSDGRSQVHRNIAPVQNDTLGFDKIFVLNLPERSDKRDFLSLAASYSNISLTFRDGIKGESVPSKALPEGHFDRKMGEPVIGSWRGHMNIVREIVENRMDSALILEDDMDWDIRIKDQLPAFATGVRSLLNQTDDTPTVSPYGDGWDVLWLGRCNDGWSKENLFGREIFAIENDLTVPLLRNMRPEDGRDMLEEAGMGDNVRMVHRVEAPICTFAYALSYKGAQKIMYSLSVGGLAWNFDNSLAWWCTDKERAYKQECIGATPTYFYQHKIKSNVSRNSDNFEEQGFADESYTYSIRVSVKKNLQRLVMGWTDLIDTYPDEPNQSQARAMPTASPPFHDY